MEQQPFFENIETDMLDPKLHLLHIKPKQAKSFVNPEHKKFNQKLKKIERTTQRLEQLEANLKHLHSKVMQEMMPLEQQCLDIQKDMVKVLDVAYANQLFTKAEKIKIRAMILELCAGELLEIGGLEIIGIYEKHAGFTKQNLNDMNDFEDDVESGDPFEFEEDEDGNGNSNKGHSKSDDSYYKSNSHERDRISKEKARKFTMSGSIKSLYRKLVKSIHPDLEQDDQARLQKTNILKKVTSAYEDNDIYELVKIMAEHKLHDGNDIFNEEDSEILLTYNKLLDEKLKRLKDKEDEIKYNGRLAFVYRNFYSGDDLRSAYKIMNDKKKEVQSVIDNNSGLLRTAQDVKMLKEYLKTIKVYAQRKHAEAMDELLRAMTRGRKGRKKAKR